MLVFTAALLQATGVVDMSYNYRCVNKMGRKLRKLAPCGYRETLKDMVHYKECPRCGCEMKLDRKRKAWTKANNCHCDGLPFTPHRRGSAGCIRSSIYNDEEYIRMTYGRGC